MNRVASLTGEPGARIEGQIAARLIEELDQRTASSVYQSLEQRVHARHRFRTGCIIRFVGEDGQTIKSATARTRNISRGGIGLLIRNWFRRGDAVHLTLSLPDAPKSELGGRIAFARPVRGGWFEVGVKFEPVDPKSPLAPRTQAHRPEATGTSPLFDEDAGSANVTTRPKGSREAKLNMLGIARAAAQHSEDARTTITRFSTSPDVVVRARAVEALVDVGGTTALARLTDALRDDNKEVRLNAIGALEVLGPGPAASALRDRLTDDSVPVRLRAAGALGRIQDQSGLPIVLHFLLDDTSHTRQAAVAYGVIVGQKFRPNTDGIAEARRYYRARKNAQDG